MHPKPRRALRLSLVTLVVAAALAACGSNADLRGSAGRVHLRLDVSGPGVVRVRAGQQDTTCDASCTVDVANGATAELSPTPADGAGFVGWGGACDGIAGCTLTMSGDRSASAAFGTHLLRLHLDGGAAMSAAITPGRGGQGTETCTRSCVVAYEVPVQASITLTVDGGATPSWSGCTPNDAGTYCLVSVDAPVDVTIAADAVDVVARDDAYDATAGATLEVGASDGVLANDEGPDLRAVLEDDAGLPGRLELHDDGSFRFTADASAAGSYAFRYRAVTSTGASSAPASVTLAISAANGAPTVYDVRATTKEDHAVDVKLEGSDPDGDPLVFEVISTSHGSATVDRDHAHFVPEPGFTGTAGFRYTASDGHSTSAPADATVTVTAVDHPPVAQDMEVELAAEGPTALTLQGSDPDGDPLTYTIVDPPKHGTLYGVPPDLTYLGDHWEARDDDFRFTVSDGTLTSKPATVKLRAPGARRLDVLR